MLYYTLHSFYPTIPCSIPYTPLGPPHLILTTLEPNLHIPMTWLPWKHETAFFHQASQKANFSPEPPLKASLVLKTHAINSFARLIMLQH